MSDRRRTPHETPGIPRACEDAERAFSECGLTEREMDAARSVLAGMTAEEAAREMGVEASTVGGFRQRAYQKLGVEDGRELTRRHGTPEERDQVEKARRTAEYRAALGGRGLTDTQVNVLARSAAGLPTAKIAQELHVAPGTVGCARSNGYRILGVHSRDELVSMLEAERAGRERRIRRGKRLALGCMATVLAVAVILSLAGAILPFDATREFLSGEANGMRSVNGVLYAVNENDRTFGSIERADLPMPWEEIPQLGDDSELLTELLNCLPDLIATTSTSEDSYGDPGYVSKVDFLVGRSVSNDDDRITIYDASGRWPVGSIEIKRFTPR